MNVYEIQIECCLKHCCFFMEEDTNQKIQSFCHDFLCEISNWWHNSLSKCVKRKKITEKKSAA